ncbi:hypothetical protein BU15DRAFT_81172 [Melanogaster broomeanus]|nr:hypothetical protein BU15DRAFT_81172 [Melanogaster broomeanus]
MAMAVVEMLLGNVAPGLRVWDNWADVHSDFSRVDLFPTILLPSQFLTVQYLFWWSIPASAYIFFLFFGLGEEARKEYSKIILFVRRRILRQVPFTGFLAMSSLPNAKGIRSFKINSFGSLHLSEGKDMSARSTSPTSSIPQTPKKAEDLEWASLAQHSDMPPLPGYSTDVEPGHHSIDK